MENEKRIRDIISQNFKKAANFILLDLNHKKLWLFMVYTIALILLESSAFIFNANWSIFASRLWMTGWVLCALSISGYFVMAVISDIKSKNFIAIFGLIFVCGLLIYPLGKMDRMVLGQDATQQLAAGLAAFSIPDWNYTGTAFLGYPNRQYLIAALPAFFSGRSVMALQLGFAYPFYLGLMMFYASLRYWTSSLRLTPALAIISLTSLFVFPYLTEYYLYFEHTLFPVCFTLQAIGWLLFMLKKPNLLNGAGLLWTCTMLLGCYTTALGSLALFIVIIFLLGIYALYPSAKLKFNDLDKKLFFALCITISTALILLLLLSLWDGRSDRIANTRSENLIESLVAMKEGYAIYFLNKPAVFTGIFAIPIMIYLILSMSFRLRFINFIVSSWIIAIVGMTQFLKGYSIYAPSTSMSRALITIPVVVLAISMTSILFLENRKMKVHSLLLGMLLVTNLCFGTYNLTKPMMQGDGAKYFAAGILQPTKYLIEDMIQVAHANKINQLDPLVIVYYTDSIWRSNLKDYTCYTFPNATVIVLKNGQALPSEVDFSVSTLVYWDDNIEMTNRLPVGEDQVKLYFQYKGEPLLELHRKVLLNNS